MPLSIKISSIVKKPQKEKPYERLNNPIGRNLLLSKDC